ncbi:MAG: Ribulose-5-phosphate 4-epimerase/Fuculose-phosphate aldolase [Hyphomicrobiales bacterium]|nr:Ribulose-5-phosphate 4-epimerase/Fuculose-phosphate aldolase [Hyphomicrobiales bacterium]
MERIERARRDVVIANRILAHQKVLDAYGHVSLRHPDDPQKYLLARSCSPGMVRTSDIVEFWLDGRPVSPETRPLYMERYIHGAVYERRPDVKAVLHSHAEDVLPFAISKTTRLRPVIQAVGDMGHDVPVWDIADRFGDDTNLLVLNMEQGRDLAACLACNRMALMRGHGFVAAGASVFDLVRLAVYVPRNARVLMAAMRMGEHRGLSKGEIDARLALDPDSPAMRRGWEFWAQEAGCDDLLAD